jgi:hypothetical protein
MGKDPLNRANTASKAVIHWFYLGFPLREDARHSAGMVVALSTPAALKEQYVDVSFNNNPLLVAFTPL